MTKRQFNVRVNELTRQQIDRLAEMYRMTSGEVVTQAVDRFYRDQKMDRITGERSEFQHWWHWAVQTAAGAQAIYETGVRVNMHRPWREIVDHNGGGHWRTQPWCDPEDTSLCWIEEVSALRAELDEPNAGIFFVEHIDYRITEAVFYDHRRDHRTLVAISEDGKRYAWRRVDAGSTEAGSNRG